VDARRLGTQERTAMWRELIPELAASAASLGLSYRIEAALAEEVVRDARGLAAAEGRGVDVEDIAAGVRVRTQSRLATGLSVRRPAADWDHLVLPPDRKA